MATSKTAIEQAPLVSRTYRAAIRLGEDFVTLEETVVLPIDATDEEIAQAVDLGWRIFAAQRATAEQQIGEIRAGMPAVPPQIRMREPDAPASDKQRNYIATLQEQLGWSSEQLAAYAQEQEIDLVSMTKGQASAFIDGLKALGGQAAEPTSRQDRAVNGRAPAAAPVEPSQTRRGAIGRATVVAGQDKEDPLL
jgi:hypothetical protein